MEDFRDALTFQLHEAGFCQRCGKYGEKTYLATLSSDGETESMAMCPECAQWLKTRFDRYSARQAQNTPTSTPQKEPVRYTPPVQQAQQRPQQGASALARQQNAAKAADKKQRKKSVRALVLAASVIGLIVVITIGAIFGGRTIRNNGSVKTPSGKSSTFAAASSQDGWISEDILCFGAYPQTQVLGVDDMKDLDGNERVEMYKIRKELEDHAKNWHSYGYYSGTVNPEKAKVDISTGGYDFSAIEMYPSDYMEYCDVKLDGEMYRGVRFQKYRPFSTIYEAEEQKKDPNEVSRQRRNGYYLLEDKSGNDIPYIYWFRWEPLRWHVIDRDNGLLLCESIIDAQPFNNVVYFEDCDVQRTDQEEAATAYSNAEKTVYANNYAESSIRQWLTKDFYNTAFSVVQKSKILTTTLNNDSGTTLLGESGCEQFDAPQTQDKVFLLAVSDIEAFALQYYLEMEQNIPNRISLCGTRSHYAECQGLFGRWSSNKVSPWFMRSAGTASSFACTFESDCRGNDYFCNVTYVNGVRPAMRLDLQSLSLPNIETDED